MLSKLFNLPWPPGFFWPDCNCCGECTMDASCTSSSAFEFTLAGLTDGSGFGCADMNGTHTIPWISGFGAPRYLKADFAVSYSYKQELDWNNTNFPDLDAYTREIGNPTVFFNNLTVGNLTLNNDAFPLCANTGSTPELIESTVDYTTRESFESWVNQFSDCTSEVSPITNLVTITNTGTSILRVNGNIVAPSGTFTHVPENAGYNTGDQSGFVPSVRLVVHGLHIAINCGKRNSKSVKLIINSDFEDADANSTIYEKHGPLDCCNDNIFKLLTDPGFCNGWPSSLTLTPSGGVGC